MNLVPFGSICKLQNGRAFKPSDWSDKGDPIVRIQNLNDESKPFNYCNFSVDEKFHINTGDLLFSWSGTPGTSFGAFFWNRGFGVLNQHIFRVDIDENKISKDYLRYAINSQLNYIIDQAHGGVGLKHITKGKLEAVEIPLPPLDEQKRIAVILDKADAIRRKRQQAINLADDFLRSVFLDMFGDPMVNPMDWRVEPWGNVLRIINGKNQKAVLCSDGEYPIMGSGGEMGRANDYLSPENSIIIGRKGNINKPILVKEKYWNVDTAFGLVPDIEQISHNYLYWFCVFFNFERLNKTVTIPSLTKADLLEVKIPVPCIEKQKLFDGIVNKLNSMKINYENAESASIDAFNSLSQKAFSGQL